ANCHRVAAGFWLTISAFAFLTCRKVLLRSSLVSRHKQPRGESWKARASDSIGSVQARTVGITAPRVDRGVADKAQTHCPRLEGLGPWFLRRPKLSRYL